MTEQNGFDHLLFSGLDSQLTLTCKVIRGVTKVTCLPCSGGQGFGLWVGAPAFSPLVSSCSERALYCGCIAAYASTQLLASLPV